MLVVAASLKVGRKSVFISTWATHLHRGLYSLQFLSIPRPQNPKQYSDQLIVIHQALFFGLGYVERHFMRWLFGDIIDENWLVIIAFGVFAFKQHTWVERALHAFVHRAWFETYSPTWNPNGP
jgi:hypothetical protein